METASLLQNSLGIIVSFIYVFAVIFLAGFLERFGKEASRKTIHILVANWWFIAMIFFRSPLWAAFVPACFVILNTLSYRFNLFSAMERGQGRGDLGTVYYAISLLILALFSFSAYGNPIIGGLGILMMGYGDGLAAVVGKKYPIRPYRIGSNQKSLAGTLTMFVSCFLVSFLFLTVTNQTQTLFPALLLSAIATVLEALTPWGLDNLSVPLLTSAFYYLIFIN